MDPNSTTAAENRNKKKRDSSKGEEVHVASKRSCHRSFPLPTGLGDNFLDLLKACIKQSVDCTFPEMSTGTVVENVVEEVVNCICPELLDNMVKKCIEEVVNHPEILAEVEYLYRQKVSKEMDKRALFGSNSLFPRKQDEKGSGSRKLKSKLIFCNQIAPRMYANDEIKAANDEPLTVAICDLNNDIISTLTLSAPVVLFLLDGELKEIMNSRKGKPSSLMSSNELQLHLQNGVGFINGVHITDNSSWTISKKFCLGIKITDESFLDEFGVIEQVVSQPFKVLAERMKGSQKRHPPSWQDEVWRLEGIRETGPYHKILYSNNINTVGDFWETCRQIGPNALKKILGMSKADKKWNKIFYHAMKCADVPTFYDQNIQGNHPLVLENEVQTKYNQNLESPEAINLKDKDELAEDLRSVLIFGPPPPPLGHIVDDYMIRATKES